MNPCPYCNKQFKNVNLHITKIHTTFIKEWNQNGDLIRFTKHTDGGQVVEQAIKDKGAPEHYYFPSDVKATKYYDTTDDTFYGIYYYPTKGKLEQYKGYTCGFTRASNFCNVCFIKNHVDVVKNNTTKLKKAPKLCV